MTQARRERRAPTLAALALALVAIAAAASPPADARTARATGNVAALGGTPATVRQTPAPQATPVQQTAPPRATPGRRPASPPRARIGAKDRRAATANFVLGLVNAERKAAGLRPLELSLPLGDDVAQPWARQMARSGVLAHNPHLEAQAARVPVRWTWLAENVAVATDLAAAHRALMASPPHRANLLDPRADHLAVGVARGPDGRLWVTEHVIATAGA